MFEEIFMIHFQQVHIFDPDAQNDPNLERIQIPQAILTLSGLLLIQFYCQIGIPEGQHGSGDGESGSSPQIFAFFRLDHIVGKVEILYWGGDFGPVLIHIKTGEVDALNRRPSLHKGFPVRFLSNPHRANGAHPGNHNPF